MIYIVDSHTWIEYFIGSKQGMGLRRLLEDENNKFITMECVIGELKSYCLRTDFNFIQSYKSIKRNSIILPVLANHWIEAAEIRHEIREKIKDFGFIDSILLAKQNELSCMIVSGDRHFKGMKKVIYIGN